jgi:hypothetical protein
MAGIHRSSTLGKRFDRKTGSGIHIRNIEEDRMDTKAPEEFDATKLQETMREDARRASMMITLAVSVSIAFFFGICLTLTAVVLFTHIHVH